MTPPSAPKVREVTGWIVTPPDQLTNDDREALQRIGDRCPEIAVTTELTRQFGDAEGTQVRGRERAVRALGVMVVDQDQR